LQGERSVFGGFIGQLARLPAESIIQARGSHLARPLFVNRCGME